MTHIVRVIHYALRNDLCNTLQFKMACIVMLQTLFNTFFILFFNKIN